MLCQCVHRCFLSLLTTVRARLLCLLRTQHRRPMLEGCLVVTLHVLSGHYWRPASNTELQSTNRSDRAVGAKRTEIPGLDSRKGTE